MWVDDYQRDGYYFPVQVLSAAEAQGYRCALEENEAFCRAHPEHASLKTYPHMLLPWLDELMRQAAILDHVSAILGPDLMVWNTSFFTKEAASPSYVSWHQDLHYWGLDADDEVTAWVALSPATSASGCMRFVAGSHAVDNAPHRDTFSNNNLLSRGQELAVEVDESNAVDVVLQPGQMSLHHGKTYHASHPNRSDDRRIGVAIRYIKPSMAQANNTKTFAALVHGEDRFGHFQHAPAPASLFAPADRERALQARLQADKILYADASQAGLRTLAPGA